MDAAEAHRSEWARSNGVDCVGGCSFRAVCVSIVVIASTAEGMERRGARADFDNLPAPSK